jgi:hypothetical protein
MAKHERGCTMNPDRVCGLCEYAIPSLQQKPIADLVACLACEDDDLEAGMAKLRDLAQGCPGCILAAIRQSKIRDRYYDSEYGWPDLKFDFKKELEAWWATIHDSNEIHI